jgi:ABC-type spermidine/putrescine transport system permease subunit II
VDAARRSRFFGLWSFAVYLFLYAPLAVFVLFSFNRERLTAQWRGFIFD